MPRTCKALSLCRFLASFFHEKPEANFRPSAATSPGPNEVTWEKPTRSEHNGLGTHWGRKTSGNQNEAELGANGLLSRFSVSSVHRTRSEANGL